ncbi:MAG: branched-chain amino acid ABC transporter permease [Acidimicrobiia bacterium]|nr:branched-chain amino acid ABC transporter permease [Acidimicrobiia bacterium]
MRGRPGLFTRYEDASAILPSGTQKVWLGIGLAVLVIAPFIVDRATLILLATAVVAAIGAIGLNLVTGYAGQVSLGHAFFLGVGAYSAAAIGGQPEEGKELIALGLDLWISLPLAGLIAALCGIVVAPVALRLRGLYLALVTLGLVFLGEHIFRNWTQLTGGQGVGREPATLSLFGYRFDLDGSVLGIDLIREQQIYFLALVVMVVMALLAKNLVRSRVGRAFAAVRDRDIAAEVMGVNLTKYKVLAFAVSSFYAGVAGALLYTVTGFLDPNAFNLFLSIAYIAMVVIGGAASIAGSIAGAFFITLLPEVIENVIHALPIDAETLFTSISTAQIERILFGVLIIVFLIFEPLGLYGIWIRIRNYWKAFPFSY